MDDIDPDKALAALEAERERRLQAKIDAGEVVLVTTHVVVHRGESVEEATARAVARHPIPDDGSHHRKLFFIFTGVPGPRPDPGEPSVQPASSEGNLSTPSSEEPVRRVQHLSPTEPAYIFVTIRNGDEDDPGQISEALWSVDEDGCVVVTTLEGKHITGRALLKHEDPLTVARALLREAEQPKDFNRAIHYPPMGHA